MRPIRLTMQAFGPYRAAVTIDFEPLNRAAIFLICGPTGGGKTSILDAISFALYGSATGGSRSFRQMRATSAGMDEDTVADLTFSLGGSRYRFRRSIHPQLNRKGDRSDRDEAACWRVSSDGTQTPLETSSPMAVTKYAESLLGFTHEQFSQLIVLPQGEFRRLLLAKSSEKEKILQRLFHTARWEAVTRAARADAEERRAGYERLCAARQTVLEGEGVVDRAALTEMLLSQREETRRAERAAAELSKELAELDRTLEALRETARRFDRLEEARRALDGLLSQERDMREMETRRAPMQRAWTVRPLWEASEAAAREAEKRRQDSSRAVERLREAEKESEASRAAAQRGGLLRGRLDEERSALARLDEQLISVRQLSQLKERLEDARRRAAAAEARREEAARRNAEALGRVQKGEEVLRQQQERCAARDGWALRQKESEAALDAYRRLHEANARLQEAERRAGLAAEEERAQRVVLAAMEERVLALERSCSLGSAAELAARLEDGRPCPVCGSLEHPAPAAAADIPDFEQLRLLRVSRERQARAVEAAQTRAAGDAAQAEAARGEARRAQENVRAFAPEETEKAASEEAGRRFEEAEAARLLLPRVQALLETRKTEAVQSAGELEAAQREEVDARQALAAADAAYHTLCGRLPHELRNETALLAEKNAREKEQASIMRELEALETAAAAAETALVEARLRDHLMRQEREKSGLAAETAKAEFVKAAKGSGVPLDTDFESLPSPRQLEEQRQTAAEFFARLDAARGECARCESQVQGVERPALPAAEARRQTLAAALSSAERTAGEAKSREAALEKAADRLETLCARISDAEEPLARSQRMAELLGGKNPLRLPVHQFVLSLQLDEVIASANLYFDRLSGGQYSLGRKTGDFSGNGSHGLEFEVFDAHRGGAREVATLSGGEMFLASLSLAFGLADVVQRGAGGVGLDSLFIDEGFGTLDDETRDAVMETLGQLRSSGRVVGLISHVAELRETIPARIEIIRHADGTSTARQIVPEEE